MRGISPGIPPTERALRLRERQRLTIPAEHGSGIPAVGAKESPLVALAQDPGRARARRTDHLDRPD